jgi:DNA repair photolyase
VGNKKPLGTKMINRVGPSHARPVLENPGRPRIIIKEVYCKNALVKSRIEGIDYALNPYTGCQHACLYCYAEFMKKYTNHKEPWGKFVDAKINVVERLEHQIKKAKPGVVMVGTVTDAYQPIEKNFGLTRRCLELFVDSDFTISIQTKSDLVLRDIDVLKKIKQKEVGLTIACPDSKVGKVFEPGATDLNGRLKALEELNRNGIPTFVFGGPIFPFFSDSIDALRSLFEKLEKRKISKIYLDKMNYLKGKWRKIEPILDQRYPNALRFYQSMMTNQEKYVSWLRTNLKATLSEFSFESEILY